ncbi:methionine--tRNA ligase [Planctomyces sp. SH-PL14]|uniref:methionine--tRNA ligase n=1 Tax=Planctomyces sp. SH-PL14 TaxID=1632864 RepID=UPI00078B35BA|nr:methionine--tRNA ligase [Planctomyces sp. SH-PL14]AMV21115.1 Methionine--tRNA ligase [Planctomyces sp. SH-PL14]
MSERRILVTSALPYANGHIHIGHLVEYIQTDIWVRFQKLRGHRCVFMCADDTHGTAIMIRARQEGRTEEAVIADMREAHVRDFSGFDIAFDNYGSTNSEENRELCHEIWGALRKADVVVERTSERLYDPEFQTFLADRFVKGTCPKCGTADQHGDGCEVCLTQYAPTDLINPKSTLSGATPVPRESTQLFVQIEGLHEFLDQWTQTSGALQSETANYLKNHFLNEPLRDWDVSRPAKYFGFEIPDSPGNFWYVWFDAPIGYIASTAEWCQKNGEKLDDWWKNPATEVHHFIGKDITYFHTLFWPAMLKTAGFNLPKKVHIHGFLTVDGKKMSKRDGTFISAATYLKHLDPSYLRYYYASKQGTRLDDLDLNLDDFQKKIDSDLVGKVVNIASRCAKLLAGQTLAPTYPDDGGLFAQGAAASERIAELYEACDYNAAMREIVELANRANEYIDRTQPWMVRKDPARQEEVRAICSIGLNLFRQIVVYLAPVLPRLAQQTGELLGTPVTTWADAQTPLVDKTVHEYQHMMKRVEPKKVSAMVDESKPAEPQVQKMAVAVESAEQQAAEAVREGEALVADSGDQLAAEPLVADHCSIDDLMKADLRVARVIEAKHVEGADKLLQLTLSLGGDVTRNVFAGIKKAYKPEDMIGQLVICCANLKPRQMKFGLSEGMVLAVGPGGSDVFLLRADSGAKPGMRVH